MPRGCVAPEPTDELARHRSDILFERKRGLSGLGLGLGLGLRSGSGFEVDLGLGLGLGLEQYTATPDLKAVTAYQPARYIYQYDAAPVENGRLIYAQKR